MKNILLGLIMATSISAFGQSKQTHNKTLNKTTDLPMSKYFKVVGFTKKAYDTNCCTPEIEVRIQNISNYTFGCDKENTICILISGDIIYKWHSLDDNGSGVKAIPHSVICSSDPITDGHCIIGSRYWKPDSVFVFDINLHCHGFVEVSAGSYNVKMDEITMILNIEAWDSADNLHISGAFAQCDLLPQWKERQAKNSGK